MSDHAPVHLSIVIAADKILADFARILSLLKGVKSSLPPHQNTFLTIPVTPKHFSGKPRYVKTLFLPAALRQNTFGFADGSFSSPDVREKPLIGVGGLGGQF